MSLRLYMMVKLGLKLSGWCGLLQLNWQSLYNVTSRADHLPFQLALDPKERSCPAMLLPLT